MFFRFYILLIQIYPNSKHVIRPVVIINSLYPWVGGGAGNQCVDRTLGNGKKASNQPQNNPPQK